MMNNLLPIVFSLLYLVTCQNQNNIIKLPWAKYQLDNAGLPPSIEVYRLSTPLSPFGHKLTGGYAKIDLSDPNLQIKIASSTGPRDRFSTKKWAQDNDNVVYAAVNGGYFDWFKGLSFVCQNSKVILNNHNNTFINRNIFPTLGTLGYYENRSFSLQWVYSFGKNMETYTYEYPNICPGPEPKIQDGKKWNIKQGLGGGPILMKNGRVLSHAQIMLQRFPERSIVKRKHPRSGICKDEQGKFIILVIDGRIKSSRGVSLAQFAKIFESLGCVDALNLDGGGSSMLYANHRIVTHDYRKPRKVPTAILVRDKYKKNLNKDIIKEQQNLQNQQQQQQIQQQQINPNHNPIIIKQKDYSQQIQDEKQCILNQQ